MDKAPEAFRTISEVAQELDVPQHVLRFWETRFKQIRPMKRGGGRRYYRLNDVELLKGIRHLLYGKGYTIKGVQRIIKEHGVPHVTDLGRGDETQSEPVSEPTSVEAPQKPTSPKVDKADVKQPLSGPVVIERKREVKTTGLSDEQSEELKLALADLSAAKRLLNGEKKS